MDPSIKTSSGYQQELSILSKLSANVLGALATIRAYSGRIGFSPHEEPFIETRCEVDGHRRRDGSRIDRHKTRDVPMETDGDLNSMCHHPPR